MRPSWLGPGPGMALSPTGGTCPLGPTCASSLVPESCAHPPASPGLPCAAQLGGPLMSVFTNMTLPPTCTRHPDTFLSSPNPRGNH